MQPAQIHLLINKKSRRSKQLHAQISAALLKHHLPIAVTHEISTQNPLADICRKIIADKPALLLIGGGDGTVSRALHYLAGSEIEVGIIPLGTTNNFARSLHIPFEIDDAVRMIKQTKAHPVDLGIVNGEYFANVVGLGLSTSIAKNVNDRTKKRFGRLAYSLVGLKQLFTHRAFTVTITDKDNDIAFSFETHQVIIANGRYHAGKKIAADAAIDNRELVVFALGGHTWRSFAWHTLDFYFGKRKRIVHGSYVVGRNIQLTTSRIQTIEIDGETGPTTPLQLQVAPGAVRVRHKL